PLLEVLTSVPWASMSRAADLGCGTGRTGAWLRRRGVAVIDGVDLTPEMLAIAGERDVYRRLVEGDVAATGLDDASYDLVTVCLVDEHLAELPPLYREAWRLAKGGARLVLVGFDPHMFIASGMRPPPRQIIRGGASRARQESAEDRGTAQCDTAPAQPGCQSRPMNG